MLIWLIAAHSVGVGLLLLALPDWAVAFGGWEGVSPPFFIRQAGVFHLLLAAGYLLEVHATGTARLLILAKSTAFVFLLSTTLLSTVPWAVPVSAVGDGLMAVLVCGGLRLVSRDRGGDDVTR